MINTDVIGVCWLIFLVVWVVSSFFAKKSVTKRRWGWRWILIIAIILFVVFINRGNNAYFARLFFTNQFFPATTIISIIAIIFAVAGLIGAVWARVYLGRNWSGYVTYKKKHELVTDGPYKYVRHPIYSSMMLMFIGTWLSFPTIYVSFMFLIYLSIFLWRKGKEEAIMIKLFGKKYKDYMKHTKALIPWVW